MKTGTFRRVLVPVEFDDVEAGQAVEVGKDDWIAVGVWTIEALELAARLARDGEVWLVHAAPDFYDYATVLAAKDLAELDRSASRRATTVLEAIAQRHCRGVSLHYAVAPGKPLDVILETAKDHPPDAIVLAASSRGRVHRAFLGSTADEIIRQSPCPVVVVPSGTT